MIDPQIYMALYYVAILVFSIIFYEDYKPYRGEHYLGIVRLWVVLLVLFIALRPLTDKFGFGDTLVYERHFAFAYGNEIDWSAADIGFELIQHYVSPYSFTLFAGIFALIYVLPQYYSTKKLFRNYSDIAFLILISSLSFIAYGVNGMRNGAAMSLTLFGMVINPLPVKAVSFLLGASIHKSALLPIIAYGLTKIFNKSYFYLCLWSVVLFISLFYANTLSNLIMSIDFFNDDRLSGYVNGSFEDMNTVMRTGFRYDFLLYSFVPIYIGYRYIKNNKKDMVFKSMFNTYLITNAFWLMTVYVPYNNRFAYLSWFLYPVLLTYPYAKDFEHYNGENLKMLKKIVSLNCIFTILMWLK